MNETLESIVNQAAERGDITPELYAELTSASGKEELTQILKAGARAGMIKNMKVVNEPDG